MAKEHSEIQYKVKGVIKRQFSQVMTLEIQLQIHNTSSDHLLCL